MATWYLLNTIRFKNPNGNGVSVLKAGSLINDAYEPLANVLSAGGKVVSAGNTSAAAAAAIAQAFALQGATPDKLDATMLAGLAAGNRVAESALAGATVAAAAAICPAITFTPVGSGKVRIRAWASIAALAAGTFTPIIKQGSTVIAAPAQLTGAASQSPYSTSVDFELDGLTPLTSYTFSFVTTAGDATVTLGHGASGVAASFSIDELS